MCEFSFNFINIKNIIYLILILGIVFAFLLEIKILSYIFNQLKYKTNQNNKNYFDFYFDLINNKKFKIILFSGLSVLFSYFVDDFIKQEKIVSSITLCLIILLLMMKIVKIEIYEKSGFLSRR